MSRFTVSGAVGLLLGAAAVAWVRPDSLVGATFIVVACCLAAVVIGSVAGTIKGKGRTGER